MKIKRKIGVLLISLGFRIYNLGSRIVSKTGIELSANRITRNYRGNTVSERSRYDRRWIR